MSDERFDEEMRHLRSTCVDAGVSFDDIESEIDRARASELALQARVAELERLDYIVVERNRQDSKWGEQNHRPNDWVAILGEEFGEAAKSAVELTFGMEIAKEGYEAELQDELTQIAAVAVAFKECLRRGKWRELPTPPKESE
jgi:hypothetical protein